MDLEDLEKNVEKERESFRKKNEDMKNKLRDFEVNVGKLTSEMKFKDEEIVKMGADIKVMQTKCRDVEIQVAFI